MSPDKPDESFKTVDSPKEGGSQNEGASSNWAACSCISVHQFWCTDNRPVYKSMDRPEPAFTRGFSLGRSESPTEPIRVGVAETIREMKKLSQSTFMPHGMRLISMRHAISRSVMWRGERMNATPQGETLEERMQKSTNDVREFLFACQSQYSADDMNRQEFLSLTGEILVFLCAVDQLYTQGQAEGGTQDVPHRECSETGPNGTSQELPEPH